MYKNTNWIKRGAVAAVAAGLMLGALPGVALAQASNNVTVTGTDVPSITKNWTVKNPSQAENNQDLAFNFQLKYKGVDAVGGNDTLAPKDASNEDLKQDDTVYGTTSIKVSDMEAAEGSLTYSGSQLVSEILKNVKFVQPGRYKFEISEVNDGNPNTNYEGSAADKAKTILVDVVWKTGADGLTTDEVEIDGVYVFTSNDSDVVKGLKQKSLSAQFDNTAMNANSLTVSKKVAGSAAKKSDDFTFTVELSGISGQYDVTFNGVTSAVQGTTDLTNADAKIVADSDGKATITVVMGNDDSFVIDGLPEGATWNVSEAEEGKNYDEFYKVDDMNDFVAAPAEKTGDKASTGDREMGTTASSVVFRNDKGFLPETGITMNTLPFVGVAAVAAAGAVTLVISRKRRAGEEF